MSSSRSEVLREASSYSSVEQFFSDENLFLAGDDCPKREGLRKDSEGSLPNEREGGLKRDVAEPEISRLWSLKEPGLTDVLDALPENRRDVALSVLPPIVFRNL